MLARIVDREKAHVTSVHVVLGWRHTPPSLASFEDELAGAFAGFLKTTAEGCWYDEQEVSVAYDFTSDLDEDATAQAVHDFLEEHGGSLDVSWVHVETWPSTSHHVAIEPIVAACAGKWPRWDRTRDELLRAAYEEVT